MLHKIRQQTRRWQFTESNRLPLRHARQFLLNYMRFTRRQYASAFLRACLGLVRWTTAQTLHKENRISYRSGCFITGRGRGSSRRFTVARTHLKRSSGSGYLSGLRKSSW